MEINHIGNKVGSSIGVPLVGVGLYLMYDGSKNYGVGNNGFFKSTLLRGFKVGIGNMMVLFGMGSLSGFIGKL